MVPKAVIVPHGALVMDHGEFARYESRYEPSDPPFFDFPTLTLQSVIGRFGVDFCFPAVPFILQH